jgi:hypothetical protein
MLSSEPGTLWGQRSSAAATESQVIQSQSVFHPLAQRNAFLQPKSGNEWTPNRYGKPRELRQDVSYLHVAGPSAILGDKHLQKLARPVFEKIALGQLL